MVKKTCSFILFCVFMIGGMLFAEDTIVGFWKTISEETKKPQSVVAIYHYKDKYYGRLIATYDENGQFYDTIENPKYKAKGVKGHPFYSGLDFIWDLEKQGAKYINGTILDPEKGNEYAAEAWLKNDKLVVRGSIFFLGKNQVWPKAEDSDFPVGFKKPDLTAFVPKIPEPIDN